MGRSKPKQPKDLPRKLHMSRLHLGLTQGAMAGELTKALDKYKVVVHRGDVPHYETGKRTPTVLILLAYARAIGVSVEDLIDDEFELKFK